MPAGRGRPSTATRPPYVPQGPPTLNPGYAQAWGLRVKYWGRHDDGGAFFEALETVTLAPGWYNDQGEWMLAITNSSGVPEWVPAYRCTIPGMEFRRAELPKEKNEKPA